MELGPHQRDPPTEVSTRNRWSAVVQIECTAVAIGIPKHVERVPRIKILVVREGAQIFRIV